MTISLGGIALDDSIIWEDRHLTQSVEQVVRRVLGGSPVIRAGALGGGVPITLVATQNYGWLSRAQATAVLALADTPGSVVSLVYGAEVFEVVFRHNDAPAVDLQPLLARQAPLSTDHYIGRIKLLTV